VPRALLSETIHCVGPLFCGQHLSDPKPKFNDIDENIGRAFVDSDRLPNLAYTVYCTRAKRAVFTRVPGGERLRVLCIGFRWVSQAIPLLGSGF